MDIRYMTKQMRSDTRIWFPEGGDLTTMILGVAGEAGECADILKKLRRGSVDEDDAWRMMVEELIDVLHYVLLALDSLDADPVETYLQKREFNQNRWGTTPRVLE